MRNTYLMQALLCITATIILYSSCRKNDKANLPEPVSSATIDQVNRWLEAQHTAGKPLKNEKIQRLADNLDFKKLRFEDYANGEKFIIVPIKKEFISTNNKGRDPINNLVLFVNKSGTIRKGNIVQFIPEDRDKFKEFPQKTIQNYFTSKPMNVDGEIAFLSITDWFLKETTYKNGRAKSFTEFKQNHPPTEPGTAARWDCYAQYLVTTTYNEFGDVIDVDEEYLGTFCVCAPGTRCDEIGGDGGGGDECCGMDQNTQATFDTNSEDIPTAPGTVITDPSTGKEIKTKVVSFRVFTGNYLNWQWRLTSWEVATLSRSAGVPRTPWKFESITHGGMTEDGETPPCHTVSFDLASAVPEKDPGGAWVSMKIIGTVKLKFTCVANMGTQSQTITTWHDWYVSQIN